MVVVVVVVAVVAAAGVVVTVALALALAAADTAQGGNLLKMLQKSARAAERAVECDLNLVWYNRTEQSKLQWPRTQSEFYASTYSGSS